MAPRLKTAPAATLRQSLQGLGKQAWQWVQQSLFAGEETPISSEAGAVVNPSAAPQPETTSYSAPMPSVWAEVLAAQPSAKPLRVVFSARALHSWSLTWRGEAGTTLRLPLALKAPPPEIAQALVAWSQLVMRRPRKPDEKMALRQERKNLETQVRAHLDQLAMHDASVAKRHQRRSRRFLEKLTPQGQCHDLRQVFAAINAEYFAGKLQAEITWSHRLGGLSTHCEKKHPDGGQFHLITISRGYDSPDVTPEILGGVVYHECLHIVHPPEMRNGRRSVHGRAFRQAEKQYRHYAIWMHWHRHGLPRALRKMGMRR